MELSSLKKSKLLHLCLAISFFTEGIFINLVQLLLYYTIRPLDKRLFWKINWYLVAALHAHAVFMATWWCNSKLWLYVSREDYDYLGKEHALFVGNHIYENDWLVGIMLSDHFRVLGNIKSYVKKVVKYAPGLGWCWALSDYIFLSRSFDKDETLICDKIQELADYTDPVWLFFCAEGTRLTEAKYKASLEYARAKNLPQLKHHLLPRTKGFTTSMKYLRHKFPALYNVQIAYEQDEIWTSTIHSLIVGTPFTTHLYLKRIPIGDIPEGEAEQAKFLMDMWSEKDRMQQSFFERGDFFATSGVERVDRVEVARRWHAWSSFAWMVCIVTWLVCHVLSLLVAGEYFRFAICAGSIVVVSFLGQMCIALSESQQFKKRNSKTKL